MNNNVRKLHFLLNKSLFSFKCHYFKVCNKRYVHLCVLHTKRMQNKNMTWMLHLLRLSIFVTGIHNLLKTGLFCIISKKFENLLGCVITFKTVALKAQSQLTTPFLSFATHCPTSLTLLPLLKLPAILQNGQDRNIMEFCRPTKPCS